MEDSFELILIIFGTLFTFFFIVWVSSVVSDLIPKNRFDRAFSVRDKRYGRIP